MAKVIKPGGYKPASTLKKSQEEIKYVKDHFEDELSRTLNLTRVSAPLFVLPETGLNDDLNGVERAVEFDIKETGKNAQIVHSLAKWKRNALAGYGFLVGEGLYTDMNAIRRDEETDNLHSIYVDQWDWEKVIDKKDRTPETLKDTVEKIFGVFKNTETFIKEKFPYIKPWLPDKIEFITTQELEDKYPNLSPKERENEFAKEHHAFFLMKIGGLLNSGVRHDGRAPDYDDWELNGDIIFYNPLLDIAFEVSSMGIRVSEESLVSQLKEMGCEERLERDFHKALLNCRLPYTIGGGIGQSRICMYLLHKAHIGEVQASIWPDEMIKECAAANINLL